MDLEGKLAEAGKTSAKLTAVRAWLDTILGAFAANPEPRNDWPKAPFGFEETVQDAAMSLSN
jgi:non-canonical (house-cleaning) NTP pyrophosphatase